MTEEVRLFQVAARASSMAKDMLSKQASLVPAGRVLPLAKYMAMINVDVKQGPGARLCRDFSPYFRRSVDKTCADYMVAAPEIRRSLGFSESGTFSKQEHHKAVTMAILWHVCDLLWTWTVTGDL
jgi:hypothetical protein